MVTPIDPEKVRKFEEIYDAIIQEGIEENLPPENTEDHVKKRGKIAQTKAKNFLDRFIKYKEEILRFLNDLRFRLIIISRKRYQDDETTQKISGTFRSIEGAVAFCRIRRYISTIRKNDLNVMDAILAVLNQAPLLF